MVNAIVYKNIIPKNLINDIIEYYDQQPEISPERYTEADVINKSIEYNIPGNFIFGALNPYMNQLFGTDHKFVFGSYKLSSKPYKIHVDSKLHSAVIGSEPESKHQMLTADNMQHQVSLDTKAGMAVLVPLVEGPMFRTITFKNWSVTHPTRYPIQQAALSEKNHLLAEDFGHDDCIDVINYLSVDIDYQWCIGDMLVWDRNQWHMSNNFLKHQVKKKFLILFMA